MSSPDKAEGRIRDTPWPSPRGSRMRFAYPGYEANGAGCLPLSHRIKGMVVTVAPLARARKSVETGRGVARVRRKAATGKSAGPDAAEAESREADRTTAP